MATEISNNQPPLFTVGEISIAVRRALEGNFSQVRVRGEVSGCSRYGDRCYLQLKEGDAVLRAVVWNAAALNFALEDGQEVIAHGKITAWQGRSFYQLSISNVEPAGEGAWLKLLNQRKKKLYAEGLFAADRKKPLPKFPHRMALITSTRGAAIEDVLRQVRLNWPMLIVQVWAVAVQGENAPTEVIKALAEVGDYQPRADLVVITRGGGSLEDLMAFNDEAVVRAVAACPLPTVSAIGHQSDDVLTDLAADKSVATPTAVAEVLPSREEWLGILENYAVTAKRAAATVHGNWRQKLDGLEKNLPHPMQRIRQQIERLEKLAAPLAANIKSRMAEWQKRLAAASERLGGGAKNLIIGKREFLEAKAVLLESLSHRRVLERGYALVENPLGRVVTTSVAARTYERLAIQFKDGRLEVTPKK